MYLLILQEAKVIQSQQRWDQHQKQMVTEQVEGMKQYSQAHNAKITRIEHFRNLEAEGQRKKDLRIGVSDQKLAMYRSQVLP